MTGQTFLTVDAARLLTKDGKIPKGSTQKVRTTFQEVGLPYRYRISPAIKEESDRDLRELLSIQRKM